MLGSQVTPLRLGRRKFRRFESCHPDKLKFPIYLYHMILTEGRKEDVYNKYKDKIDTERKLRSLVEPKSFYDILLEEPFMEQTNYKYLEPLVAQHFIWNEVYPRQGNELEELEPNMASTTRDALISDRTFVSSIIPKLEFFEKNKDKYPKKDFKQYVGWDFENEFINFTDKLMSEISKRKEKEIAKKDSIKLYEDNDILVVKPLTHQSSCYYGSGTKWCTTMTGTPSYFDNYTSKGNLYYIILKKMTRDNKFSKIALYLKPGTNFDNGDYYNTKDDLLTKNEIELFKNFVIQKAVDSINEDNDKSNKGKWFSQIERGFKDTKWTNSITYKIEIGKGFSIEVKISELYDYSDLGDFNEIDEGNHITYSMNLNLISDQDSSLNDYIFVDGIIFDLNNTEYAVQYQTESQNGNYSFIDGWTDIKKFEKTGSDNLQKIIEKVINIFSIKISKSNNVQNKYEDWLETQNVKPKSETGYVSQGGGKLTKEMINYLDALGDGEKGNRLDFFQKTGVITTTPEGNFNKYGNKVSLQGYYGAWFSGLNKAGIITTKPGVKGFTKGPNFEKFKEKILSKK